MTDLTPEAAVREATTRLTEALADLIVASGRLSNRSAPTAPATATPHGPWRLYSVAQLAKLWSVSTGYVYSEIQGGRLQAVQMGNGDRDVMRVPFREVERWEQERVYRPGRS